jgi:hypothetical protein
MNSAEAAAESSVGGAAHATATVRRSNALNESVRIVVTFFAE